MAENPTIQVRTAQMKTPATVRKPIARSACARQGGSERIRSLEDVSAVNVGRAIAAHLKLNRALLGGCPAGIRGDAEEARTVVCSELLVCIGDIEELHRAGKQPKLVARALRIIDANQKRLMDIREADPGHMERARAMLGHVEALDLVERLVETTDLDDEHRRPLLARALGEVSLLMERGSDALLASAALDTVMVLGSDGQDATPRERRAALAAMLMQAGPEDVVPIPQDMVDAARGNLIKLTARVLSATGSGKRWERIHEQAVMELAEAYGDMVVLDRARRENPPAGPDLDRSLIGNALDKVVNMPPSNAKRAAAVLMMSRLHQ